MIRFSSSLYLKQFSYLMGVKVWDESDCMKFPNPQLTDRNKTWHRGVILTTMKCCPDLVWTRSGLSDHGNGTLSSVFSFNIPKIFELNVVWSTTRVSINFKTNNTQSPSLLHRTQISLTNPNWSSKNRRLASVPFTRVPSGRQASTLELGCGSN